MNKKDLEAIRVLFDLQTKYGEDDTIRLNKVNFKELLEYA